MNPRRSTVGPHKPEPFRGLTNFFVSPFSFPSSTQGLHPVFCRKHQEQGVLTFRRNG